MTDTNEPLLPRSSRFRPPPDFESSQDCPNDDRTQAPAHPPHPAAVCCCICVGLILMVAFITLAAFLVVMFFPYTPGFHIDRVRINDFHVTNTSASAGIVGSLETTASLTNKARFFALAYRGVSASATYRTTPIGFTHLRSVGELRQKESWTVSFGLKLDGTVVNEEDLARLSDDLGQQCVPVRFNTQAHVKMGFYLFHLPFEETASCTLYVSPANQSIVRFDCQGGN